LVKLNGLKTEEGGTPFITMTGATMVAFVLVVDYLSDTAISKVYIPYSTATINRKKDSNADHGVLTCSDIMSGGLLFHDV